MARLKYAASMPHCRPMMNVRPQITSVLREDQHAGLAQRLAEVAEDLQAEDLAHDAPAEADDVAERREPVARDCQPVVHLMLRMSGWVASSVCVNT